MHSSSESLFACLPGLSLSKILSFASWLRFGTSHTLLYSSFALMKEESSSGEVHGRLNSDDPYLSWNTPCDRVRVYCASLSRYVYVWSPICMDSAEAHTLWADAIITLASPARFLLGHRSSL